MQPTTKGQRDRDLRMEEYPALAALRLTEGDLRELAHQGFLSEERRGVQTYYKLRFRRRGRQIVRYVGGAERAAIVNNELSALQAESKILRALRAKAKIANLVLREVKRQMEPVLRANGFKFHGLAIRRPRHQPKGNSNMYQT